MKDRILEFYSGTEKEDKVKKLFELAEAARFPKDETKKVQMISPVCEICFKKENLSADIQDVYDGVVGFAKKSLNDLKVELER